MVTRIVPSEDVPLFGRGVSGDSQAADKEPRSFCNSERIEESLFLLKVLNRREIPRFARNDNMRYFFDSLFRLGVSCAGENEKPETEASAT